MLLLAPGRLHPPPRAGEGGGRPRLDGPGPPERIVAMAQDGGLALLVSWALVAPLPPSWAAPEPSTGGQVATAPVAVKFIRERGGKPPMRFVDVTLELRN